jgi:hypothetical protein
MSFREIFPATSWTLRVVPGKVARRAYLSIILLVLAATSVARVHSLILTKRIHLVLSGLEHLQTDRSTEDEVLRTVPYLQRGQYERPVGWSFERTYYTVISNESQLKRLLGNDFDWGWRRRLADWLGYRYLYFDAQVILLDGKVSTLRYDVANEFALPRSAETLVSVRSFHGFWHPFQVAFGVTSADDENPQYRVQGTERNLYVAYSFDAPSDLVSHAFDLRLSCFIGLRGCQSAREIALVIWEDKKSIQAAAKARLESGDPCPDRILPGRVKYLLDANLVLMDVQRVWTEKIEEEGHEEDETFADYKVAEVLRGRSWTPVTERIFYRSKLSIAPGSRILMFSNHRIESCGVVSATPSALAAVRNAVPAPKRPEDEWGNRPM